MTISTSHNENDLLLRIAAGDEKAFRELFDQYWDNIYSVAFTFTKSAVLSEEIVQDVFVKVWLKREQLPGIQQFKNWLFIIARNQVLNELDKKINDPKFTAELKEYFAAGTDSPEQRLLLKESEQLIEQAIQQLSPQQQTIYRLSREQGLSHEQIAERLQLSKNTVKVHMSKALHGIRGYIERNSSGMLLVFAIFRAFL